VDIKVNVASKAQDHNSELPDLKLPDPPPQKRKEPHSFAIALLVATVFLLAAIGIAIWLFMQKGGQSIITQIDPNSTTDVTNVSWAQPALPEGYKAYGQSTVDSQATYFANTSEGCSVYAKVFQPTEDELADLQAASAKAQDYEGIATKAGDDSKSATIKDADGEREYDFAGVQIDQTLSAPTRTFDSQTGTLYYKQFGHKVATISHVCKVATADVNAEDLRAFVTAFTVETER
jgi:hypothetical protein